MRNKSNRTLKRVEISDEITKMTIKLFFKGEVHPTCANILGVERNPDDPYSIRCLVLDRVIHSPEENEFDSELGNVTRVIVSGAVATEIDFIY